MGMPEAGREVQVAFKPIWDQGLAAASRALEVVVGAIPSTQPAQSGRQQAQRVQQGQRAQRAESVRLRNWPSSPWPHEQGQIYAHSDLGSDFNDSWPSSGPSSPWPRNRS